MQKQTLVELWLAMENYSSEEESETITENNAVWLMQVQIELETNKSQRRIESSWTIM